MYFDKNITHISHSSSESGYSNISKKLIDIICEEKYEDDSRKKSLKGVKWHDERSHSKSTNKVQEQINFKMQILQDKIIRKRIKNKRSNLSGGFKNNLSNFRLSPIKDDSPVKLNGLVLPHHKRIETDKNDKLIPYVNMEMYDEDMEPAEYKIVETIYDVDEEEDHR